MCIDTHREKARKPLGIVVSQPSLSSQRRDFYTWVRAWIIPGLTDLYSGGNLAASAGYPQPFSPNAA